MNRYACQIRYTKYCMLVEMADPAWPTCLPKEVRPVVLNVVKDDALITDDLFDRDLAIVDTEVYASMTRELGRQLNEIELIASENIALCNGQ